MAEDQETAEYAQHRLPDITPVETVTNIFLYPISITSMLMWTIKLILYVTGVVIISHESAPIGSTTYFQPRVKGRGQD